MALDNDSFALVSESLQIFVLKAEEDYEARHNEAFELMNITSQGIRMHVNFTDPETLSRNTNGVIISLKIKLDLRSSINY
jgi:hypothetical protein